jgi:DNA-binding IclR family transcriptional regulator
MAGQRSKPTERVVRILELLGAHPGTGLRFSELAREGGLSQATCHAILGTLAEAGFVVRDAATLTYTLGPALVALGTAASESYAEVRGARAALEELSRRTGLGVSAATVVDDSIVVVDVIAAEGGAPPIRVGTRVPCAPPFGAIHVAWSDRRAIDAWVARSPRQSFTPARLYAVRDDHRATHLAVAPYTTTAADLRAALGELAVDALASDVRERTLDLLSAIDDLDVTSDVIARVERLPVNTLTAPVFGANGLTAFAVAVHVGSPDVAVEQIQTLGAELLAATRHLTETIGGTLPDDRGRELVAAGGKS